MQTQITIWGLNLNFKARFYEIFSLRHKKKEICCRKICFNFFYPFFFFNILVKKSNGEKKEKIKKKSYTPVGTRYLQIYQLMEVNNLDNNHTYTPTSTNTSHQISPQHIQSKAEEQTRSHVRRFYSQSAKLDAQSGFSEVFNQSITSSGRWTMRYKGQHWSIIELVRESSIQGECMRSLLLHDWVAWLKLWVKPV